LPAVVARFGTLLTDAAEHLMSAASLPRVGMSALRRLSTNGHDGGAFNSCPARHLQLFRFETLLVASMQEDTWASIDLRAVEQSAMRATVRGKISNRTVCWC
jgi:hypothetical protein